jgi:hypothetical protein
MTGRREFRHLLAVKGEVVVFFAHAASVGVVALVEVASEFMVGVRTIALPAAFCFCRVEAVSAVVTALHFGIQLSQFDRAVPTLVLSSGG